MPELAQVWKTDPNKFGHPDFRLHAVLTELAPLVTDIG
jgi:hypothetical protein